VAGGVQGGDLDVLPDLEAAVVRRGLADFGAVLAADDGEGGVFFEDLLVAAGVVPVVVRVDYGGEF